MSNYYDSIRKEVLNNKQDAMIADAELENEKNIPVERVKNGVVLERRAPIKVLNGTFKIVFMVVMVCVLP